MTLENQVSYTSTNTYNTLNTLTKKTKNVWLVFHGMGYLSKYFIEYFSELDAEENYIIAPQAPAKYYQDMSFKRIGASWLTRENTKIETQNILNYVDAVFEKELSGIIPNLIVMGYSQGVSVAARWVASRKIQCSRLIIHSGGIPKELSAEDFAFQKSNTIINCIYGTKDPFITEARKLEEEEKGLILFQDRLKIESFDGVHEVNKSFLKAISKL